MNGAKGQNPSDWMNMTASDWINMTPSDWMNRTLSPMWSSPMWNRSWNDLMNTRPMDWVSSMSGLMTPQAPAAGYERSAYGRPTYGGRERERDRERDRERKDRHHDCGCHEHHHSCGCRRCKPDSCECKCCIGDVDFAVYARVGEQRVIPIVVENERRREVQVTAELSNWSSRGGNAVPVDTVSLDPKTFTIPPCGEQKLTLVVKINAPAGGNNPDGDTGRRGGDVDDCLVATADLRLAGCDARSLRIAIAILPRDCDPYEVKCGCTCC